MNITPQQSLLLLINLLSTLHQTSPFLLPHNTPTFSKKPSTPSHHTNPHHRPPTTTTTTLHGKLWEALQTDESPNLQWYLLNCIVGTEETLLAQCIHSCTHFSKNDVDRFVVPTERLARSHGKRNVVDDLVLYPGYVFARIRLCEDVYETIQQLSGCRSWMGTIRKKNNMGHQKLPSLPEPLTEDEVAQFRGLEEKLEVANNKTASADDLMTEYDGFEVGSYVKITTGKFGGEEGIVKRLKKGKISVRMYTYGSQYDEWFSPNEMRVMTELEVMRGLQGPERPINQEQFDVSIGKRTARDQVTRGDSSRRGLRNELMGSMKGGQRRFRNRKEDRVSRGENKGLWGNEEDIRRERDNWEAYKKKQIDEAWKSQDGNSQGGGGGGASKHRSEWGDFIGRSSDVTPGRQNKKKPLIGTGGEMTKREEMALDGDGDDWGDYFSEDDFFDGLVDDLKGRQQQQQEEKSKSKPSRTGSGDDGSSRSSSTKARDSNDDDDFFSSLMNELADSMEDDDRSASSRRGSDTMGSGRGGDLEDDFFMELEKEMTGISSGISGATKESTSAVDEEDDFFASLEREMTNAGGPAAASDVDDDDDKQRQQQTRRSSGKQPTNDDDFFASLEEELSADVDSSFYDVVEKTAPTTTDNDDIDVTIPAVSSSSSSSRPPSSPTTTTTSNDSFTNYSKMTVAVLKEKLKERGMKVSGKKADLIERLQSSS